MGKATAGMVCEVQGMDDQAARPAKGEMASLLVDVMRCGEKERQKDRQDVGSRRSRLRPTTLGMPLFIMISGSKVGRSMPPIPRQTAPEPTEPALMLRTVLFVVIGMHSPLTSC